MKKESNKYLYIAIIFALILFVVVVGFVAYAMYSMTARVSIIVCTVILAVLLAYFVVYSLKRQVASENMMKQVKAVSSIYVSMYEFNLRNDTYKLISSAEHIQKLAGKGNSNAYSIFVHVLHEIVVEEYLDGMLEFANWNTIAERLENKTTITHEFVGKVLGWCRARYIVMDSDANGPTKVLFTVENINDAKLEEERLISESTVDKLTGCFNRKAYEEELTDYKYTLSGDNINIICASIDVNELKAVNDDLGHDAGDELLKGATKCMRAALRSYGRIYRVGGDEFTAILKTDKENLAEIRANLANEVKNWRGQLVPTVSLSCGFASESDYPEASIHDLVKLADKDMYEDKARYYRTKGIDRRGQQDAYNAIRESYTKILLVDLTKDSYQAIRVAQNEQTSDKGFRDTISMWLREFAVLGQVHEADREEYLRRTQIDYLRDFFRKGNRCFSMKYRRLIGIEFRTVLMEMVPSPKYKDDEQLVFLYVKDISDVDGANS